jgi:hypothetical protein
MYSQDLPTARMVDATTTWGSTPSKPHDRDVHPERASTSYTARAGAPAARAKGTQRQRRASFLTSLAQWPTSKTLVIKSNLNTA